MREFFGLLIGTFLVFLVGPITDSIPNASINNLLQFTPIFVGSFAAAFIAHNKGWLIGLFVGGLWCIFLIWGMTTAIQGASFDVLNKVRPNVPMLTLTALALIPIGTIGGFCGEKFYSYILSKKVPR